MMVEALIWYIIYLRGSVPSRLLSIGAKTGAYVLCHVSLVEGFVSKNEIDNTFNVLNRAHLFLNIFGKTITYCVQTAEAHYLGDIQ